MSWTQRINTHNADGLAVWESYGLTAANYTGILTGASNTQDILGVLASFTTTGNARFIQSVSLASPIHANSSTAIVSFAGDVTEGNSIIVDFGCVGGDGRPGSAFLATISITDTQGNVYTLVADQAYAPGTHDLSAVWMTTAGSSGPNTITVTTSLTGINAFTDYVIGASEYRGLTGFDVADVGSDIHATGIVSLDVNTGAAKTLLHLFSFTRSYVGVTATGGGVASLQCMPAWLAINEPGLGWVNQSIRLHVEEQITFSWIVKQRGTATVPLYIAAGDDYEPTIGSQVCLWDITEDADYEVFSGTIDDTETKWLGQKGDRMISLTCVSLEQCFDTIRLPNLLFENKTAGFIFTTLYGYAAGAPVALGDVDAGATITQFLVTDYPSIAEMFDRLAELSQYVWGVDPGTGTLYFHAPNFEPSPFVLSSEDVQWEQFTLKSERHDFRNRQILKVNANAAVTSSEYFTGSGQSSYTMLRPIDQITNAWLTQNIQNSATGTFTGQPDPGDRITVGYASTAGSDFVWSAGAPFPVGSVIVDSNGYFQKVTVAVGVTGATEPNWIELQGQITQDNLVTWQNQGPAGFADGNAADYTFMAVLDNTQFGGVLIGATVAETAQNLADAINGLEAKAGITFSLPTWENPLLNADEPAGATTIVVRNKPAGQGYIAALGWTSANFSFNSDVTSGGITTFGTNVITFGVAGQTTGGPIFTIVYNPGSNIVQSATPLQPGNNLQIEYKAANTGFIQVEDTADVDARAIIEGGTGKYQQTSSDDSALSLPQGLQLAQQQLAAYGVIPQTFEFTTLVAGLYTGQVLDIEMDEPHGPGGMADLVNGTWFIQEINAEVIPIYGPDGESNRWLPGGGHFRYTIRVIDVAQIGSWIDFWLGLGGGGSGGGSAVYAGGGSLGPNSNFPQDFSGRNIEGSVFTAGEGFAFDLASFLHCSATGASFTGRFSGAIFKQATFTNAVFNGTFIGCDFTDTNLDGASFTGSFIGCLFTGCPGAGVTAAAGTNFTSCDFVSATWTAVDMPGCDFTGCNFQSATFQGDLHGSSFVGVRIHFTAIDGSNFQVTNWAGVQFFDSSAGGCDFTGVPGSADTCMVGCSFVNTGLTLTIFDGADLTSATFFQSGDATSGGVPTFAGCNLTGTRFPDTMTAAAGGFELVKTINASYTVESWDANKLISVEEVSPHTAVTISLPSPVSDTWQIAIQNTSSFSVTLARGGVNIDGVAANLTIPAGGGVNIYCDGSNYFTERGMGGGSSITFQTNTVNNSSQTALNLVAGTGVTLTNTSGGNVTIAASGGGSGALTQLGQVIVSSPVATISFATIPGSYTNLKIVLAARCTAAVAQDNVYAQFNADIGSNYVGQFIAGAGSSVTGGNAVAAAKVQVAVISGASAASGTCGTADISIPVYSGTAFHKVANTVGEWTGTSSPAMTIYTISLKWANTAAITDILLGLATALNTFAAGTTVTLYGES